MQSTMEQFQRFRDEANEEKVKLQAQIEELARKNYHLAQLGQIAQEQPRLPQALPEPRDIQEHVPESNRGRESSD